MEALSGHLLPASVAISNPGWNEWFLFSILAIFQNCFELEGFEVPEKMVLGFA